jgi:hypothetical protein
MGLARRTLADGEVVVYQARPHWTALGTPLLLLPVCLGGLAAMAVAAPGTPILVGELVAGAAAVCALWLAARTVRWLRTTVALTSLRIVERSGLVARRGEEVLLDRITAVSYRQSLLGAVVGAGRLVVDLGGGDRLAIDHVRQPARLQALVAEQLSTRAAVGVAGGGAPPGRWVGGLGPATPPAGTTAVPSADGGGPRAAPTSSPRPGASVAERLSILADLHRRGLVTDDELRVKRAQLLDEL